MCVLQKERETERGTQVHTVLQTYRDFLLSHKAYWVCATDTDRGYSCCLHCLEGIFWTPPPKTHRTKQSGGSSRERDPAGTQTDRDGQENKRWDGQQNNKHIPTWYKRPSGEKMVMWRSYPAPDPLLMVSKPSMLLSLLFSSLLYSSSSASSSRVVRVLFSQLLSSKTVPRNPNS